MEEIGSENFLGITTDNDSAMIKARELIIRKFNHISHYSCANHYLNLMIDDIAKI